MILPRSVAEVLSCGAAAHVASSGLMLRFQPFLDWERHMTLSSQTRTAQA